MDTDFDIEKLSSEESNHLKIVLKLNFLPRIILGKRTPISIRKKFNRETAKVMLKYIDVGLIFKPKYEDNEVFLEDLQEISFCIETPLFIREEFTNDLKNIIRLWNKCCLPLTDRLYIEKSHNENNRGKYNVLLYFDSLKCCDPDFFTINREEALDLLETMASGEPYNPNGWNISGKRIR